MKEANTCWQQTPYGKLKPQRCSWCVLYTNWDGNWKYYADRLKDTHLNVSWLDSNVTYSALVAGDYEVCDQLLWVTCELAWSERKVVDKLDHTVDPGTDWSGGNGWSATKVYNAGDQVAHNGATYEAKWWTQGMTRLMAALGGGCWSQLPAGRRSIHRQLTLPHRSLLGRPCTCRSCSGRPNTRRLEPPVTEPPVVIWPISVYYVASRR